ncbi:aminotransferase class III-fold pyridoxal phosphate-dependent enzyme, partial [archaeon]|nr:aminotransferase class III-fold pyridoxal phosphate-dependent enzyme [archaeon]
MGLKGKRIIALDRKLVSGSLTRVSDLAFERMNGCNVWDTEKKKYLDFTAGIAVANCGHSNKEIIKAVKRQLDKGIHFGFSDWYAELPLKVCTELKTLLPKNLNNFFYSNSGTESVEAMYKCARWHSKKKWFIAFEGAFHGRTMGALSLTKSKKVQKEWFEPFMPVRHVPYAYCYRCFKGLKYQDCGIECLKPLEKQLKLLHNRTAGIAIEMIQGENGYIVPPKEFVKGVRQLADDYKVLLCDDEVQAGCFRTGKFLASETFRVEADIIALSKALGNGLPIGLAAANKKIMDWPPGAHANTFGGNLAACASALAALKFMKKEKLGENALRVGKVILNELKEIQEESKLVGDVRGLGLMLAVELVKDRKTKEPAVKERDLVVEKALRKGLVLLPAGESS